MSTGLLASLRKYSSREKHNPLENFITEAFAWLLKSDPDFSNYFIDKITSKLQIEKINKKNCEWVTQENFDNSFPDMVCFLDNKVIVFENKAWSGLHTDQLKKYRDYASANFDQSWVVLITATKKQHAQNPDLALCWNEVHQFMSEWISKKDDISFIFQDFIQLLEVEGMGPPAPISHESLKYYYTTFDLEKNITALVQRSKNRNWADYFKVENIDLWFHKKWGRVGINFLSWNPAVFIGVMFNGTDHCTTPISKDKGPDACLLLSFDTKLHRAYPINENYKDLTKVLSKKISALNDGWEFYNHLEDSTLNRKNKWHPIHIRKPIIDILVGTQSIEEQEEAFFSQVSEILNLITSEESFWKLRESLE